LAYKLEGKFNPKIIGEPIPSMLNLVKENIKNGNDIKIFTARVSTYGSIKRIYDSIIARYYINIWVKKNVGYKLDIVCAKDFKTRKIYDDIAISIKTNEGV
jgi:hypothetical protein